VYDKPKNKWYELKSKPGQEKKNKFRGEIEVKVNFTVQSGVNSAASLADLKKDGIRASFGQLSQKMGELKFASSYG
jgi:Rab11 family-interacting protein 1/2/5